jgi:hypothetical protein
LINRAIANRAEVKREYLQSGYQIYNHDAGSGVTIGGYGHPASNVGNNWLGTVQGDSKNHRDGDYIFSKWIDFSIHGITYEDRTNQQMRVIIVRGTGNLAPDSNTSSIADWFIADGTSTMSGNLLTTPVDKQKYTVLYDRVFKPLVEYNGVVQAATGNDARYPVIKGRIKTGHKVSYITGTTYPNKSRNRIQVAIIPYGDTNAQLTDNICRATIELVHYFYDF